MPATKKQIRVFIKDNKPTLSQLAAWSLETLTKPHIVGEVISEMQEAGKLRKGKAGRLIVE